jgi:hypothetical protein
MKLVVDGITSSAFSICETPVADERAKLLYTIQMKEKNNEETREEPPTTIYAATEGLQTKTNS